MPFNQPIDINVPADTDFVRFGAKNIRDLTEGIKERMGLEHQAFGDGSGDPSSSSAEGRHKPGETSVVFQGTTAQITALTPSGTGCLAYDTTLSVFKIWNGTAWSAVGEVTPVGTIGHFSMDSDPAGWIFANGDAISRTDYADLFAAIGTLYGAGDGSTTFNLPDYRGYFLRGRGTNSDGTAAANFADKQADEIKSHTHTYTRANSTVGVVTDSTDLYLNGTTGGIATGATGGSETRPKNIAVRICIKF